MKKNTIIAVSIPVILGVVTYVLIGRLGITDVTFLTLSFSFIPLSHRLLQFRVLYWLR